VARHLERDAEAVVPAQRGAPHVPRTPSGDARTAGRRRARRLTALGLGLWALAFGSACGSSASPRAAARSSSGPCSPCSPAGWPTCARGLRSVVVDFLPVFGALAVYDLLRGSADDLTSSRTSIRT
jgi:hypothetical protein